MKDKLRTGRIKVFVILAAFVVVLVCVGILMHYKLRTLLEEYAENQVAGQAIILAELMEQNINSELTDLENLAWYIEQGIGDMDSILKMMEKDGSSISWGVLELGGDAVCGERLEVADYPGIQESFRGKKAVCYKEERGLLLTVPVRHGSNIKYVLYKLIDTSLLRLKFGMDCYDGEGRVLVATKNNEIVVPYLNWKNRDMEFFQNEKTQEAFGVIREQMQVVSAASVYYREAEVPCYLFMAELQDYELLMVGTVPAETISEGLFYVGTLILWVFGLLLLLLVIGMIFLFGAEEKAEESEQLRQAKAVADAANRAKSDFLANMSHEIRTPINAVMGMNEMILRECEDEEIKEYAVNIQNASKTLLALINDILDLSKIESGKMELAEDYYQLSAVLNDVVNMIQIKAEQKGLAFRVQVDESIPNKLYGDEVRIRQIMVNILNNAVKYTKEGSIFLRVEKEILSEDMVCLKIAVTDTGIGIRTEDMSKLFSVFERLDSKENKNVEGTGLGLSITSKFVEMMHGRIEVESVYGVGSTFTVYLPQQVVGMEYVGDFERNFHEYMDSLQEYEESFVAPNAQILVVDDNEMNLFVVEGLLKKTRVNVTCCTGGESALRLIGAKHFDVILLDHMMPGMDGIETLKRIKEMENSPCKDTPIIALTANAIVGVREMYLSEGFDDYLCKPIVGEKLEELLKKYLLRGSSVAEAVKPETKEQTKKQPPKQPSEVEAPKTQAKATMSFKTPKKVIDDLFREELDIQHKLLNLILSAAFGGGIISLGVSVIIGLNIWANLTIAFLIAVVGVALWIANSKRKPQAAALLIVILANMVIFPVMYFTNGGMMSGMPIWLVLGLIFSWLILKGRLCFVMYSLNAVVTVACILLELYFPDMVVPMEGKEAVCMDMIQSMIVVTCIFGLIFKYQTRVYERQKWQLVKANQAKNEFLANMSHEIRTPINAILGYNELIMKEGGGNQTSSHALKVQSAGRTLLSLVNNVLDYTNMEKGKVNLKREPYSFHEVLQDIVTYAEYCLGDKALEFRLNVDESIPRQLSGDAIRLIQVMDNLISNAVKYTREGYVEIDLRWQQISDKQGVLSVSVEDTGIGMKEEDVRKISQSFIRFDNQQTRNIQGIGLGLTIVTRLLYFMGSCLKVESEFGKGSTFSFELNQGIAENVPIGSYHPEMRYESGAIVEEENFRAPGARALLVDDNMMNLDLLKGIMKGAKMQIDTAANGEEALELVRKKQYHVILMDHMMPVMDGVEALQKMKEEGLCENTPVIVLTANAVGDARENYLQIGFDDYLSKPIHSRQLFAMLKKYISKELLEQPQETEAVGTAEMTARGGSFLEQLSFLDAETGMLYCGNSEEFYKEMLASYLNTNKYHEILQCYEAEDWKNYRILVHGLKSTSLSIGAVEISEAAKELELAVKEDRIDFVRNSHEAVMFVYKELLDSIRRVTDK